MFVQRFDTNYSGLLGPAALESARVLTRRVVVLAPRNKSCALTDWQKLMHPKINRNCEFNDYIKGNDTMLGNNDLVGVWKNWSWSSLRQCIHNSPRKHPETLLLELIFGS
jgi:hypothetical protein